MPATRASKLFPSTALAEGEIASDEGTGNGAASLVEDRLGRLEALLMKSESRAAAAEQRALAAESKLLGAARSTPSPRSSPSVRARPLGALSETAASSEPFRSHHPGPRPSSPMTQRKLDSFAGAAVRRASMAVAAGPAAPRSDAGSSDGGSSAIDDLRDGVQKLYEGYTGVQRLLSLKQWRRLCNHAHLVRVHRKASARPGASTAASAAGGGRLSSGDLDVVFASALHYSVQQQADGGRRSGGGLVVSHSKRTTLGGWLDSIQFMAALGTVAAKLFGARVRESSAAADREAGELRAFEMLYETHLAPIVATLERISADDGLRGGGEELSAQCEELARGEAFAWTRRNLVGLSHLFTHFARASCEMRVAGQATGGADNGALHSSAAPMPHSLLFAELQRLLTAFKLLPRLMPWHNVHELARSIAHRDLAGRVHVELHFRLARAIGSDAGPQGDPSARFHATGPNSPGGSPRYKARRTQVWQSHHHAMFGDLLVAEPREGMINFLEFVELLGHISLGGLPRDSPGESVRALMRWLDLSGGVKRMAALRSQTIVRFRY